MFQLNAENSNPILRGIYCGVIELDDTIKDHFILIHIGESIGTGAMHFWIHWT